MDEAKDTPETSHPPQDKQTPWKPIDANRFYYFPSSPPPEYSESYSNNGDRVVELAAAVGHIRELINGLQAQHTPRLVSEPFQDWQQIGFGAERQRHGAQTYRGYLMIEPESLDAAMQRLCAVGQARAKAGKRLEFKWFLPLENMQGRATHKDHFFHCGYIGSFESQLVTIYGDSTQEIQDIFSDLIGTSWEVIEETRQAIAGKWVNPTPIKGQERFVSTDGKQWATLEFNTESGTEEQISARNSKSH